MFMWCFLLHYRHLLSQRHVFICFCNLYLYFVVRKVVGDLFSVLRVLRPSPPALRSPSLTPRLIPRLSSFPESLETAHLYPVQMGFTFGLTVLSTSLGNDMWRRGSTVFSLHLLRNWHYIVTIQEKQENGNGVTLTDCHRSGFVE